MSPCLNRFWLTQIVSFFQWKKKKNQCERMTHVTKIKVTDSDRAQKVVLENIIRVTLANPSALYIVECH
jgi:hypothetical protein